jgi:ribosomal protein RSM22 (predicted rRNA methylase)
LNESQLLEELRSLQQAFTQDREGKLFKEYMRDARKVSAYTSFYLPTNLPKFSSLWLKLRSVDQQKIQGLNFVDVGCGPGTYSLAFLLQCSDPYQGVIRLIDHSSLMLEQAVKVLSHFFPKIKIQTYESISDYLKQNFDPDQETLFFGHSLNEMSKRESMELFKRKPKTVLWIEPGTPQVFTELIEYRDELILQGYECLYPCLADSPCPAVAQGHLQWCHQSTWTSVPPELHRIAQILELNRHHLPMMAHAYLLQSWDKQSEEYEAVLVRKRKETKHSFEWEVCAYYEARLQWLELSLPKKTLSKNDVKKMEKIDLGEKFKFEVIKVIAANSFRVRLVDR